MAPSKVQLSQRQDWKLSRLKPYDNNPLNHDPSAVSSLAEKIREFGFVDPITVDEDGVILWGHKRRLAAMELKLETVPVVVVSGLTEIQKQTLRISHNQEGRKSAWDIKALVAELEDLEDKAGDLSLTGFTPAEIQGFFKELTKLESEASPESQSFTEESSSSTTQEIDVDSYEFEHQCPKCGFEFN
jgi:ParB-like chromosome segregation protein Spo0J